jgi:preprotein translocase subunit SecE
MENKFLQDIAAYFKGVKAEWGKITWPEKDQVIRETFFVLAIVIAFTIFVYVVDLIFKFGLDLIVK